jgi:hypothetical protein
MTRLAIHLADGAVREGSDRLVMKEILRVGRWPVTPTRGGRVPRPLTIVADGPSDPDGCVISLAELAAGFRGRAPLTLSRTSDDHDAQTGHSVGWVRSLRVIGDRLVARLDITEPDVKEKVLRGTYADVSAGIPFGAGGAARLDHVCITNRPFIDGLGPFVACSISGVVEPAPGTLEARVEAARTALGLPSDVPRAVAFARQAGSIPSRPSRGRPSEAAARQRAALVRQAMRGDGATEAPSNARELLRAMRGTGR